MNNINYNDFKTICRTCLFDCDLKFTQSTTIIEVLDNLGVRFETNDELPQQICVKCVGKINEIHEFALQCKQTYSSLINCLKNYKNMRLTEEQNIIKETNEVRKIKEEITSEEHKIEFVGVEELNSKHEDIFNELKINHEILEETNNLLNEDMILETGEFNDDQNINYSDDDLFEPNTPNIKNEETSVDLNNQKKSNNKFKCDICNKSFNHLRSLLRHKRVHSDDRPFKCDLCAKTFTESSLLKYHQRVHSGERPYICEICNKAFTQSGALKIHKRLHSGERPYNCDQCGASFNRTNHLKRHLLHHSGERPFKCDVCSKSFYDASKLKVHQIKHTGERPFKCDVCYISFNDRSVLYKHKVTHSSERPFECDVCGNTFKISSDLLKHKRTHSDERPHKCDVCNKSFINLYGLKRHKKIHDKNIKCG